jgi:adenosylcobinamide-phosphate synthase
MVTIASDAAGAAPLVLLLIVLVADGLFGGLPGVSALLGAPLAAVRRLTGWFDRRLNRAHRGEGTRRMRGLLVVVIVALLAGGAGAAVIYFTQLLPYGWMLEALAVLALLGQRERIARLRGVSRCLALKVPDEARRLADPLVRYDAAALDGYGVARAAVEGSVIRFAEGCVGTVFWYLLLGLPALCVYRAVGAAADAIGRPSPRHAAFGFVARRLDDVLSLPAAIIAGPVVAAAALFVPQSRPAGALRGWARDLAERGARADFRAEGAMAGALGLALGGPRPFDGATLPGPWIGDGRARATVTDVHRAAMLVTVACLLVGVALALAVIARAG